MRRATFPPKNRRRQQITWPPKRRFGCGVGSVGLKAPSFKEDTAQKRWNREAKAADRADHRWRHEEAAAAAAQNEQAQASAFEAEEEDARRRPLARRLKRRRRVGVLSGTELLPQLGGGTRG